MNNNRISFEPFAVFFRKIKQFGGPDIGCYNESHIPDPNAINMGGWPAENQKQ